MRAFSMMLASLVLASILGADVSPTARLEAGTDLGNLAQRVEALEQAAKKPAYPVKIEGYAQLRYEDQGYKVGAWNSRSSGLGLAVPVTANVRGAYFKRVEMKLSGVLLSKLDWVIGFGFDEGKLKDVGTVWSGLPLFHLEGYTWILQAGQFRQKFGIEPQTGSPKLAFHERAILYGGAHPFPATNLKMVGERVLGLHAMHSHQYEVLGYDWGWSISNDANDQSKGSNSLGLAFPTQAGDENPTLSARLGLKGGPAKLGVSWQRNSKDTVFMASLPSQQAYDEILGIDWRSELPGWGWVQAEYVALQAINGATGLGLRQEGYYTDLGVYPLGFLGHQEIEDVFRYERITPLGAAFPAYYSSATLGLSWTYGRAKTSVNYAMYAVEDDFGAMGNTSLFTLQQQFTY